VIIRVASVVIVPEENIAQYERLHAAVWPDVREILTRHHMTNYSIFRHGEVFFSYLEYTGDDLVADNERIAKDPATQRWWDLCKPLMSPYPQRAPGDWWMPIPEVFHHA
jgi:L-rhamnose mutarotase